MDSEKGWTLLFWAMIVLGVLAVVFRGGSIEQDLTDRANAALHENGLQWASVKEAHGRNIVLTGEAPVKDFRNRAKDMVSSVYGVRHVDDENVVVKDPASPYSWMAVIAEGSVTLTGSVPDEETRESILKKAEKLIAARPIIDKMILADGSPDSGWLDNIISVLKYTKYLKSGAIHLDDRSVKVEGEAWNRLDHEVLTLKAGRGRAIGNYKFSSELFPLGTSALNEDVSADKTTPTPESEETEAETVAEKQPVEVEEAADAKAGEEAPVETGEVTKEAPAATEPVVKTPAIANAKSPQETGKDGADTDKKEVAAGGAADKDTTAEPSKVTPEVGKAAETAPVTKESAADEPQTSSPKNGILDKAISAIKSLRSDMASKPASEIAKEAIAEKVKDLKTEKSTTKDGESSEADKPDSANKTGSDDKSSDTQAVEQKAKPETTKITDTPKSKAPAETSGVAVDAKADDTRAKAGETKAKTAVKAKPHASTGYYYVQGPFGAPVAVPFNTPPMMVAPPWAFSPYPARPAYAPNCAFLHPNHPAYCGRPAYR